jgi:quinol monooxygenase YgiN
MTVHQLARYQVRQGSVEKCVAAIKEFVAYLQENEPTTLEYVSLQQPDDPTRFVHYFIFQDEAADELHSQSEAVKRFSDILYPELVEPVEFIYYRVVAEKKLVRERLPK